MRKPHYPPRNAEPQGESPTFTMRYDRDVLEQVDEAAKRAGVTRSEWIRSAVESALKGDTTMKRNLYGVAVRGCSGVEIRQYNTRSTADRVRRVCRAWAAQGGWTGARTIRAVAELASWRKGTATTAIIAECQRRKVDEYSLNAPR